MVDEGPWIRWMNNCCIYICSSAQRVLSDPVVRVPQVVVRKKVLKSKDKSKLDGEINEVYDLLATAQRKLQRLEEKKKKKKEDDDDDEEYEEVEYFYQFRGPQPPRGGGAGGGGFYGGACSLR